MTPPKRKPAVPPMHSLSIVDVLDVKHLVFDLLRECRGGGRQGHDDCREHEPLDSERSSTPRWLLGPHSAAPEGVTIDRWARGDGDRRDAKVAMQVWSLWVISGGWRDLGNRSVKRPARRQLLYRAFVGRAVSVLAAEPAGAAHRRPIGWAMVASLSRFMFTWWAQFISAAWSSNVARKADHRRRRRPLRNRRHPITGIIVVTIATAALQDSRGMVGDGAHDGRLHQGGNGRGFFASSWRRGIQQLRATCPM